MEPEASPPRRPAGLLVIIGTFGLAALASVVLINIGTPTGKTFGSIVAPVCLLLAAGLWCRSELVRWVVVGLLALSLAGEAVMFSLKVAGLAGVLELPANAKPMKGLSGVVFRVWFTWWMFSYLRREDVRAVFVERNPMGVEAEDPAGPG